MSPETAFRSPPARRRIIRKGQPRNIRHPTMTKKPRIKRVMGALPPMAENGVTAPEGTLVSVLTDDTQAVDCRRLVEALGGRIL